MKIICLSILLLSFVHWKSANSAATSYSINDLVGLANPNVYYYSLQNASINHTPESSPSFWQVLSFYQLKQIYKPMSLTLAQTVSLFSFTDAEVNFRGRILVKHTVTATGNGMAAGSIESDWQFVKALSVSGSNTYTDPNTKFGIGLNGLGSSLPTFSFSSNTVSVTTNITPGVGQSLISNGIYYRVIYLGGQIGAFASPANIGIN